MIPLSPSLLLSAANALVGLDEEDQTSRLARIFLREAGVAATVSARVPWDTAFVHHVGWWAHYDAEGDRSSWPFSPSVTSDGLLQLASRYNAVETAPRPGDLFLLWSPVRKIFLRTGIVVLAGEVNEGPDGCAYRECATIEGDSDEMMRGAGGWIVRHTRQLSAARGDRFIRWTALELRSLRARDVTRLEGEGLLEDAA